MVDLCLHIYNPTHAPALFRRCAGALAQAERVWLSTDHARRAPLQQVIGALNMQAPVEIIGTDNRYHDWSGYLAMMRATQNTRVLFGNETLVTRRLIGARHIARALDATRLAQTPTLLGELDRAQRSLRVAGRSNAAWISTCLFGLYSGDIPLRTMADRIEAEVKSIPDETQEAFGDYLRRRRPPLMSEGRAPKGKLAAMYLERVLSETALADGVDIVDIFAGDRARKLWKCLEDQRGKR